MREPYFQEEEYKPPVKRESADMWDIIVCIFLPLIGFLWALFIILVKREYKRGFTMVGVLVALIALAILIAYGFQYIRPLLDVKV